MLPNFVKSELGHIPTYIHMPSEDNPHWIKLNRKLYNNFTNDYAKLRSARLATQFQELNKLK